MQRTYTGFAPKGEVQIPATYDDDGNEATPARSVAFERGRPVDFETHEVALLSDGEWATPGSKDGKAAAAGKPPADPPTEGTDESEEPSDG